MKRDEYLKTAFDAYNAGKMSAEAYDAVVQNADLFVDDEEDQENIVVGSEGQETDVNQHCSAKEIVAHLVAKYPDRAAGYGEDFMERCLNVFEEIFGIDSAAQRYSCGSLEKLKWILGFDYQDSTLLFDVSDAFIRGYDPEYWVTQEMWKNAIKTVVGDEVFEKAFDEWVELKQHRIVLTCFDPDCEAYADCKEELFSDVNKAHKKAEAMATEECASLNGEDGGIPPDVGCFEVDDCANNDFEVRWYELKPEDRDEGSCDIDYVTTYNVYPVMMKDDGLSFQYRGFDIELKDGIYCVSHTGCVFCSAPKFNDALMLTDDICLECAKDKTYALEAVHKVPLDVSIKFAKQQAEQNAVPSSVERDEVER